MATTSADFCGQRVPIEANADQSDYDADGAGDACDPCTDLDGDGDNDVLSASFSDGKIAWYENTDGLGTFGDQQVISTTAGGAGSVFAADLDGDGDNDVISASEWQDKVAWYENTDGLGSFGEEQIISNEVGGAIYAMAADLDGDGDNDVLAAARGDDKIAWYENLGG